MRLMEEAARLMGGGTDGAVMAALARAAALCEDLPFHSLTRPCALQSEGCGLRLDGQKMPGRDLARRLSGCREGVLVGATLGARADALLRRAQLSGLLEGAAAQAVLSARLEIALDHLCEELQRARPGFTLTPRFSPGYGDLPLTCQPFFMERLQMARLGVRLTEGLMMVPAKSVTAVAGWRPGAARPAPPKCRSCPNVDCPYRLVKEDKA